MNAPLRGAEPDRVWHLGWLIDFDEQMGEWFAGPGGHYGHELCFAGPTLADVKRQLKEHVTRPSEDDPSPGEGDGDGEPDFDWDEEFDEAAWQDMENE